MSLLDVMIHAAAGRERGARRLAPLLVGFAVLAAGAPLRAEVKVGDTFPSLSGLTALTGTAPATQGSVVLVDFWASWCAPCKASFPMMAKLYQDFASQGLVIAAVGIDEKPAAATAFIRKLAPPFPTLHDSTQKLVREVEVPTMPTSYLIGRDGRVRFVHQGFHDGATERELRQEIQSLLAEKHPTSSP
jgi:thiol-disulfide isomerase/thioredoxin